MAAGGNIIGQAMIEVMPLTTGFQQQLNAQLQRAQSGIGGGFSIPIAANAQHLQQSVTRALPKTPYMVSISGNTKPLTDAVTHAVSGLARKAMMIVGIGSIFGMVVGHLKDAIYGFNNVIQQAQIGLETILKDSSAAADLIDKLKVFARTTPFQFADLVKNTQTLVAMGTAAEDVIPTLTAVGNTLAALGRMSQLPRVIYDLGQIRATGRLTGRELMNMAMQGIPVLKYLADATGKSMEEIREQMALGVRSARGMMIDSETAIAAIMTGMMKDFGGLMVAQMGTAQGAISNWKDAEEQLIGAIGKPLFDVIIKSTLGLSKVASDMASAFSEVSKEGGNALGAVKEVFLNLFPANAQATISAVLTNMAKLIGDVGAILKTIVATTKTWAATIATILMVALRGLLSILRPVADFLAEHKTIVKDLVIAYIALKVIGVITTLWTKANLVIDQSIGRMLALTGATQANTAANVANAQSAVAGAGAVAAAEKKGLFSRMFGGGGPAKVVPTSAQIQKQLATTLAATTMAATTFPGGGSFNATGAGSYSSLFSTAHKSAAQTQQSLVAVSAAANTTSVRMQALGHIAGNTMFRIRAGSAGAALGIELLKGRIDENNRALTATASVAQGALVGNAILPGLGAALGATAGAFLAIKSAADKATAALKEFNAEAAASAQTKVAAFQRLQAGRFGTGPESYVPTAEDALMQADRANVTADAAQKELDNYKPIVTGVGMGAQEADRKANEDRKNYLMSVVQENDNIALELRASVAPGSPLGDALALNQQIAGAAAGDPHSLEKLGIKPESITALFGTPGAHGGASIKSVGELLSTPEGTAAFNDLNARLDEFGIHSEADLQKFIDGADGVTKGIEEIVAAAAIWEKQQKGLLTIDKDVADINQKLKETYDKLATSMMAGKTTMDDIVAASMGTSDMAIEAGKAAYESAYEGTNSVALATQAAYEAERAVIGQLVTMLETAGFTNAEIDTMLGRLGLLNQMKDIEVKITANTMQALEELYKVLGVMQSISAASLGLVGFDDPGALGGLTGGSGSVLGGMGGVKIPTPVGTPPAGSKGGGGGSSVDPAIAIAKSIADASKSFYDTIVESAKSFHDKVTELMGNPAERMQYSQALSVGALTRNTNMRAAALTDWTAGIAKLKSAGLSQMAVDALGLMEGPEMGKQVKRLLQASSADLLKLNSSITNEAEAAQKAAYSMQGDTIAKAITLALAKFFEEAGKAPGGPGAIEITNNITQGIVDPDALALRIITQLGGTVKIN